MKWNEKKHMQPEIDKTNGKLESERPESTSHFVVVLSSLRLLHSSWCMHIMSASAQQVQVASFQCRDLFMPAALVMFWHSSTSM